MNVRVPPKLTLKQQRAMDEEIRRQCVELTRKYEIELDAVPIYILHKYFGFGKQRIEKFYDLLFSERRTMQEYFKADYEKERDANIDLFAMRHYLLQDGIDVEAMYNRHEGQHNFVVRLNTQNGGDSD